ncbi:MAG: 30S ribosome-binding factor RbfA [Clostridia bacterium]|nr:30S ribosome-binding factor RbfA [Clostridia bacterium]
MPSYKLQRVTRDVERELTVILQKIKDPRVKDSLVNIVNVDLSNDYSHCKIYISSIKGLETSKIAAQGLKSASGYIKRELSNSVKLRQMPNLIFVPTDSIEYSANISKMLEDLSK